MLPNGPKFLRKKNRASFSHLIAHKLSDADGQFADGLLDGYCAYYDLNAARPAPLNGTTLAAFIAAIMADTSRPNEYRHGYVVGWSAALAESNAKYFFLEIPVEGEVIG